VVCEADARAWAVCQCLDSFSRRVYCVHSQRWDAAEAASRRPATHFDAKCTAARSGAAVFDEDAVEHLSAVNEIVRRHMASQRFRRVWFSGERWGKRVVSDNGPLVVRGRSAAMVRFEQTTEQACLVETTLRRLQAELKMGAGDYLGADTCIGLARSAFERVKSADLDHSTVWGGNVKRVLEQLEFSEQQVRVALSRKEGLEQVRRQVVASTDAQAVGMGGWKKKKEDLKGIGAPCAAVGRRIAAAQAGGKAPHQEPAMPSAKVKQEEVGECDETRRATGLADEAGLARLGPLGFRVPKRLSPTARAASAGVLPQPADCFATVMCYNATRETRSPARPAGGGARVQGPETNTGDTREIHGQRHTSTR
jgi:hypothetical protein